MEPIEIHLFHGFLGEPEDWQPLASNFSKKHSVFQHNLFSDWKSQNGFASLEDWGEWQSRLLSQSKSKKVVVGYSLGGRLASHLDFNQVDHMVLLASHPGLRSEREQRFSNDKKWMDLLVNSTAEGWLQAWNDQEVFKNDRSRPQRKWTAEDLDIWLTIQQTFSLGKQETFDEKLQQFSSKIHWACGEKDIKFMGLKNRMVKILGDSHTFTIADSGHGVIFDNPDQIYMKMKDVICGL